MTDLLDDRLDAGEPFDPHQWIMHGILSAYFEPPESRARREAAILALTCGTGVPAGESADAIRRGGPSRTPAGWESRQPGADRGFSAQRVPKGPSLALRALMGHRPWLVRGAALAAAVLLLAVSIPYALKMSERQAFAAAAQKAVAQAHSIAPSRSDRGVLCGQNIRFDQGPASDSLLTEMLASLDCGGLSTQLEAIAKARRERDGLLAAMQDAADVGDPVQAHSYAQSLMFAWIRVYRPLRDLGHFAEALAEIQDALACTAGENPLCERWPVWHIVCMNDWAETLEAMGDYEGARQAHLESVALRKAAMRAESAAYVGDPDLPGLPPSPQPAWQFYGGDLVPPYLSLSWLAVLRDGPDGLREARGWQAKAELQFRRFFRRVCASDGILLAPDVSVLDAFTKLHETFQHPDERWMIQGANPPLHNGFVPDVTAVAWLRCCLFNAARLQRVAGDYGGAAAILDQLAAIQPYPCSDEWRLDFYEPLENARVAVLQGHYDAALRYLDVARQFTGPRECPYEAKLSERPVGPLALAEAELMRGVALVGAGRDRETGRDLIRQALAVRDAMAATFPPDAQAEFLRQFTTWDALARVAR
jgi:tetratricopeptide (TPR) repeat protein